MSVRIKPKSLITQVTPSITPSITPAMTPKPEIPKSEKEEKIELEVRTGQALQVAVRVRPLNTLELDRNAVHCVEITNNQVSVKMNSNEVKNFAFDVVYGENTEQDDIFVKSALPVLKHVMNGFPGTIFCYGQTSSGKTYTMEGRKDAPGIIQRTAKFLEAERMSSLDPDGEKLTIFASFLEVYLEEVIDLLVDRKDRSEAVEPNSKLTIVEDPELGVYVKNLSSRPILNTNDLEKLISEASSRRTVAATNVNEVSSRSHLVITFALKRTQSGDELGLTSSFKSRLNLVDLAGSERVDNTGATGIILKQAIKINQSLLALGNVMNALSSGSKHVPFRDSKLTRLLQSSFQGDSMTCMIACLSPATINCQESVSTLRFADRAKQIKTRVVAPVDSKQARIVELEREVRRLRNILKQCKCGLALQIKDDVSVSEDAEPIDDNEPSVPQVVDPEQNACCIIS